MQPESATHWQFPNRTIEMFCQQKALSAQMEEPIAVNPMSTLLTNMTKTNIEI